MLDGMQQRMAEKMLSQMTPSETQVAQALVKSLTEYEARQLNALAQLTEAADVDVDLRYDRERREQMLLSLADAIASRSVQDWWFDVVGPQVMDNADTAQKYVGLSGSEWYDQIRAWHNQYHEKGIVEEPVGAADPETIGETAAKHVEAQFGISLREFVATIINWNRGEQIQPILAGPIQRNNAVIVQVAEEIDDNT
jgi:hypothetical protein